MKIRFLVDLYSPCYWYSQSWKDPPSGSLCSWFESDETMCYFTRMEDTALIPDLSNRYIPPLTGGAYSPIITVMGLWKAKRGGREGKKEEKDGFKPSGSCRWQWKTSCVTGWNGTDRYIRGNQGSLRCLVLSWQPPSPLHNYFGLLLLKPRSSVFNRH